MKDKPLQGAVATSGEDAPKKARGRMKDIRTWQETIISMDSNFAWTVKQVKGTPVLAVRNTENLVADEVTVPVAEIEALILRWREKVGV